MHAVAFQSLACATVGYLPREEAARYQPLIFQIAERGFDATCRAQRIGGTAEKPTIGVVLDLEGPTTSRRSSGRNTSASGDRPGRWTPQVPRRLAVRRRRCEQRNADKGRQVRRRTVVRGEVQHAGLAATSSYTRQAP